MSAESRQGRALGRQDFDVVVFGSANIDHVMRVDRFPHPGETVSAKTYLRSVGGKGLNQAIAAARAGASVAFVGSVGTDDAGDLVSGALADAGVDVSSLARVPTPTGLAYVSVAATGANEIIVAAGANAALTSLDGGPTGTVLLVQLEVPHEAVREAMQAFRGIVILNPAPSREAGPLLDLADVIVPNATELADLAGSDTVPADTSAALRLVGELGFHGAVVVTLGGEGALVVVDGDAWHVVASSAAVVDTTGAGDAFCGTLASRLAAGDDLLDAARHAVAAGTATVARVGAGTAMPVAAETAALLTKVTVTPLVRAPRARSEFTWGVATSAYQVEGSTSADSRGLSIWDEFVTRPGATVDGATGKTAADSYRRWREDVDLIADLGVSAYRFSISWPRVQPDGETFNEAGLDVYDRMVDALLERGIEPFVTLYHWDLPLAIEAAGGWPVRQTADRFAVYAGHTAARLGDRVKHWITINEPFEASMRGYAQGRHAPGRTDPTAALRAAHHLLLAHGLGGEAVHINSPQAQAGIVLNLYPVEPASSSPEDVDAAARLDLVQNRFFLDPVLDGAYSSEAQALLARYGAADVVREGDEAIIAATRDFLGVNYYTVYTVQAGTSSSEPSAYLGAADAQFVARGRVTDMGLAVRPDGLITVLQRVASAALPVYVTECGAAYRDVWGLSGIADFRRRSFLSRHADAVQTARRTGIDVRGFFVWTLLDNFEWSDGFTQRFGLVDVDRTTGVRTRKASFEWYARYLGHREKD
ncbi:MAG: GH1 family beta-glucosidase [Propionibacteriaceae bacterium]|nr:GH1 family beta-glucosidase [Propionibacteriaceae bacterium]